jgi:hypothetical protein
MTASVRSSPFTAGALVATLAPDQITSAHAIAEASMFPSEALGPEWSPVRPNPDGGAAPPPLCERFKASVYDRTLDLISDYRIFSAPNHLNAQIGATVFPSEAVATSYFDEMLRPDYQTCLLQYVDITLVSAPFRSTSVLGPVPRLRNYGDRVLAIQTISTITNDPAPILGAANPAIATGTPSQITIDSILIQVGRAIVEVDLAPDDLAPDDPAGIVDRALSALVQAAMIALAKT